ncbi:hypothetical protein HU200_048790 [Digitaria exilis]|uniref:Reverse transcriptase zinc-binding domain-containing protein n=1 Tax=Digitaria exilis TaxID=1010633 RepID=A0A835ECJ7_9POAL|nr:hypothetical protein HU200_048790 [Digitaria exilis]
MLLKVLSQLRASNQVHLGNNAFTSFWLDHWVGPMPLSEMFPALLSFCQRPNAIVGDCRVGNTWDFHLEGRLSSTAAAERDMLFLALQPMDPQGDDIRGIGDAMAPFTASAFYARQMESRPIDVFADAIWNNAATPRYKHFLWLVHHHRLPSAILLHR